MFLLPAIDILGGRVVRLAKGDYRQVTVYNEDPVAQAKVFEAAGARWIHVVDLDGARSGRPEIGDIVCRIAGETSLAVQIGGGIRDLESLEHALLQGASRVVLGTALARDPAFALAALNRFGAESLVAGIDAKEGMVAACGWCEATSIAAYELARKADGFGFRHLVYTDISRDGMQTGLDPASYVAMSEAFDHPVVASGGVAGIRDIENMASVSAAIEGIICGRALYEGSLGLAEALLVCSKTQDPSRSEDGCLHP